MTAFRYEAREASGVPVSGVIEAESRKSALHLLGERGLYPSTLELGTPGGARGTTTCSRVVRRWRREVSMFTAFHGVAM